MKARAGMGDPIVATSRTAIREGSKSFSLAAALFDRSCREDAYQLYAWCRRCDDEIDGQHLGHGPAASAAADVSPGKRLARLRRLTDLALGGVDVDDPAFAALGRVARRHRIPQRYPRELLDGFAMDVDGRAIVELDDCLEYSYHVAGVVGLMMAHVMGVRDAATLDRATDLGIAFQLTNIARDVIDDAGIGRVYLPQRWLEAADVPTGEVGAERHREKVFAVVSRLLDEADRYYASAVWGLGALGVRRAWAIATAAAVYREIGETLRRRGPGAWDRRIVVGRGRKLVLALWALPRALLANLPGARRPPRRRALWRRPSRAA